MGGSLELTQLFTEPGDELGITETGTDRDPPQTRVRACLTFYGVFIRQQNQVGLQFGKQLFFEGVVIGQGDTLLGLDARCPQSLEKAFGLAYAGDSRNAMAGMLPSQFCQSGLLAIAETHGCAR